MPKQRVAYRCQINVSGTYTSGVDRCPRSSVSISTDRPTILLQGSAARDRFKRVGEVSMSAVSRELEMRDAAQDTSRFG